jgi:hypothetical protein
MEFKMETRDMVRMANQIGAFFKSYGEKEALEGISDHINKFWEPRMRKDFFAYLDLGGDGLDPLVAKAASLVKRPA